MAGGDGGGVGLAEEARSAAPTATLPLWPLNNVDSRVAVLLASQGPPIRFRVPRRKKAMKPPGWKPKPKAPAKPKPKAKAPSDDEEEEEEEEEAGGDEEEGEGEGEEGGAAKGKAGRKRAASPPPEPMVYVAPTLRRSTVTRVADSQRDRKEKVKVRAASAVPHTGCCGSKQWVWGRVGWGGPAAGAMPGEWEGRWWWRWLGESSKVRLLLWEGRTAGWRRGSVSHGSLCCYGLELATGRQEGVDRECGDD